MQPDELLERLHELVTRLRSQQPRHDDADGRTVGATCLYVVYDPATRQCSMARAGHPPPVLASPDGTVQLADIPQGPPLGQGRPAYRTVQRELPEGTLIVLNNTALDPTGSPTRAGDWTASAPPWHLTAAPCNTSATPCSPSRPRRAARRTRSSSSPEPVPSTPAGSSPGHCPRRPRSWRRLANSPSANSTPGAWTTSNTPPHWSSASWSPKRSATPTARSGCA
ncbi:PP2C family protein-serine/threonine phosphatase [Streptomyces sp. NPDC048357]|uniref:PP2C family protein-serine/threonine phosphatase n=1 Tax=Streptomyces sp. NPDC048357 TaxID=3154719 RepID=UPI0034413662